jgi:GABA permease
MKPSGKDTPMPRYLIVANQTLTSDHLFDVVTDLVGKGPCSLHLLVPATPAGDLLTWTEGAAHAIAQRRLTAALDRYRHLPAVVDGEVGDANPLHAVMDLLVRGESFDLVVVSTLPAGLSRWLHQDLPHRIERTTGLAVRAVIAPSQPATTAAGPG